MRLTDISAFLLVIVAAVPLATAETRPPGVYVQGFVTSTDGKLTYVDLTQSFKDGVALPASGSETPISFNTGSASNRLVAWRFDIVENANSVYRAVLIARTDTAGTPVRAVWKLGETPPTLTVDAPGALWIVRRWPQVSSIGTSFAGSGLFVPGALSETLPTTSAPAGASPASAPSTANSLVETIAVDVRDPASAPDDGQVRVAIFGKELTLPIEVKFKKLGTQKPLQARGAFVLTDEAGAGKIDDAKAIAADNDSTEIFSRLEAIAGATGIK